MMPQHSPEFQKAVALVSEPDNYEPVCDLCGESEFEYGYKSLQTKRCVNCLAIYKNTDGEWELIL